MRWVVISILGRHTNCNGSYIQYIIRDVGLHSPARPGNIYKGYPELRSVRGRGILGYTTTPANRALQKPWRATRPRYCGRYWGRIKQPQSAAWSWTPFARHWTFTSTSGSQISNCECSLAGLAYSLIGLRRILRRGPPERPAAAPRPAQTVRGNSLGVGKELDGKHRTP